MTCGAAIARATDWRDALVEVIARTAPRTGETDLAFFFASAQYAADFPDLLRETVARSVRLASDRTSTASPPASP